MSTNPLHRPVRIKVRNVSTYWTAADVLPADVIARLDPDQKEAARRALEYQVGTLDEATLLRERDEARSEIEKLKAALQEATEALGSAINQYACLWNDREQVMAPVGFHSRTVARLTEHYDRARAELGDRL